MQHHPATPELSGVLIIDKPSGWTSHDVVAVVRKKLHTKRVGHGGTLDPMATGVLLVLVGKATKLFDSLSSDEKEYRYTVRLGVQTDTGDADGKIIAEKPFDQVTRAMLDGALAKFRGAQKQIPPMYSAIKVDGKKLYEYARKGQTVELEARDINVISHEIVSVAFPDVELCARVSKGTYIRKLAEDFAQELGTVGHVCQLRRTASGPFKIADAIALEDVAPGHVVAVAG